jgi:hypothetical protein
VESLRFGQLDAVGEEDLVAHVPGHRVLPCLPATLLAGLDWPQHVDESGGGGAGENEIARLGNAAHALDVGLMRYFDFLAIPQGGQPAGARNAHAVHHTDRRGTSGGGGDG